MERLHKGNSLVDFFNSYTIIDIETTGFFERFIAFKQSETIRKSTVGMFPIASLGKRIFSFSPTMTILKSQAI